LFGYLTGLSSRRLLAIIADDVEDFDEPSLALLANLARVVREHKLILVSASASGAESRAQAYRMLSAASRSIELTPLDEDQVEELLRSVFGDIPNLKLLAPRIYGLSAGLPRLCMELCQHMLDTGAIQGRAGGFVLQESAARLRE
jgi:predicted ATPase